ncbi:MAG: hypothetical protein M3N08_08865 [Pseudomonadota bacterium]|nr:hypothetical protein [Pseudomonadota bacterium]
MVATTRPWLSRLSHNHSQSPAAFAAALTSSRLRLARVAKNDLPNGDREQDERKEYAMLKGMKNKGVWMLATGGVNALDEKQLKAPSALTTATCNDRAVMDFRGYVSHVQEQQAKRLEHLTARAELLGFENERADEGKRHSAVKARVGTYVVITERGHLYHLNQRTTGEKPRDVQEFLKALDGQPVQSVTEARKAMKQIRLHRRTARPEIQPQPTGRAPLRGSAIDIGFAYRTSDSVKAFAASMADRGIKLAVVTKDEAEESRKQAEAARAAGRHPNATGLKENEIVAVNERGHVHGFTECITGSSFGDMQAYLRNLDRSQLTGIAEMRRHMRGRIDEENRLQKDRDRTAKSLLGISSIFDPGDHQNEYLRKTALDRAERPTIENERAANRPRNTRDR